ncbi:PaaI family thioesterase [Magnetospirillum moscoviense]|uniref:Thioesterase domain-containing protein n=1 Tax=Magnetospirillum moscoviense TaxID=1437059 RepID=A0A178N1R9_9PROT|nr:PaaI family thioesterase [Magnetospirillum moscoviense]MBF0326714.1 PaaI family thioesterase [Alphaproteobacteria bacterium]OAN66478.1 hypothetical protein A6A05_18500 [Magnetospirillum moscoviense]
MPAMTPEILNRDYLPKVPMLAATGAQVISIGKGEARLLMPYSPAIARPGDTVSGPALMALADVAVWAAVLTVIGHKEMAVTTSLTMNFLRRAGPSAIIAEARLLKMGRRLGVGAVELIAADSDELVAHATATYSIPAD